MTLRSRLILSHGIIIALTLLVTPLALYAVHRFAAQVDAIAVENVRAIEATERIRKDLGAEVGDLLRKMAGAGNAQGARAAKPLQGAIDDARPYFPSPEERIALARFEEKYAQFSADVANRSFDTTELPAHFDALVDSLAQMRALKTASLANATGGARDFASSMFMLLTVIALAALGIGIVATLREIRALTRPVDQLNALMQRLRGGDFDVVYHAGPIADFNVLGRHFESTAQALRISRATNVERASAEQRRSTAVLDSIGDGLVIFSDAGRIERINPVAERQLGIAQDDAVGKSFDAIGDHHVAAQVSELLERGEVAGSALPELRLESGGEERVLAYSLHRFVEGESERAGVVMVLRDVTVEREFDKMRSEFVLRASHELRTPIASIRMGLGLLGEKFHFPPGSRDEELFETVQQEIKRLVHLLTGLLDLSRLRAGEQTMERAPTDVTELVTDAQHRFAPAAERGRVALEATVDPAMPRLELCRNAFDRVMENLLDNALRHTPPGGTITLGTSRSARHVTISVADTGEGIASSQLALIFQPFVQVGGRHEGTGLGLAICKEIVHQHGGEIAVASQLHCGTTFTISLPV